MKRNDGFTLIELLVTVSVGTLVTFAAVSLLLLGARVQYRTTREAEEQQTVRVAMSMLEKMAGSGEFNAIETTYSGWKLLDCVDPETPTEDDLVVFEYVNTDRTIYRGAYHSDGQNNEPVLTGLSNAGVAMEGNLLRLSFETTQGGSYVTRVYCRTIDTMADTQAEVENKEDIQGFYQNQPIIEKRVNFLNTLANEYGGGRNTGKIQNPISEQPYTYYSQWYIGSGWGTNGWNKDTPWCACFLSWAADKNTINGFKFANVDAGMELFKQAGKDDVPDNGKWMDAEPGVVPTPGDYVFFDWTGAQKDPAHVGVVLDVDTENDCIYTIEGNSSGRVAVRKYDVNDRVIMGYGILPGF